MILLATSGLLAAIDASQAAHREAAGALRASTGPRLLSPFVLAELDYLVATRVGIDAELGLLDEVARGAYRLEPFSASDMRQPGTLSLNTATLMLASPTRRLSSSRIASACLTY